MPLKPALRPPVGKKSSEEASNDAIQRAAQLRMQAKK